MKELVVYIHLLEFKNKTNETKKKKIKCNYTSEAGEREKGREPHRRSQRAFYIKPQRILNMHALKLINNNYSILFLIFIYFSNSFKYSIHSQPALRTPETLALTPGLRAIFSQL